MLGMLENERALNVGGTVAATGKLEMSGADCAYTFKKLYDFVARHKSPPRVSQYQRPAKYPTGSGARRVNADRLGVNGEGLPSFLLESDVAYTAVDGDVDCCGGFAQGVVGVVVAFFAQAARA